MIEILTIIATVVTVVMGVEWLYKRFRKLASPRVPHKKIRKKGSGSKLPAPDDATVYDEYLSSLKTALAEDARDYVSLAAVEKRRAPGADFSDLLRISASAIGGLELGRGSDEGPLDELVLAATRRGSNAVIIGAPGTGKSFGIRYVASRLVNDRLAGRPVPIPIIVPLRGLRLGTQPREAVQARILQAISEPPLKSPYATDDFSQLHGALLTGQHIVFFDGINEVYHRDEVSLLAATHRAGNELGDFAAAYRESRFVYASRSIVQDGLVDLRPSVAFHLQRLHKDRATEYLRKRWIHLQPEVVDRLVSNLLAEASDAYALFLENPLAVSLLATVVAVNGALPESEHALFSQYVQQRLRRDLERGLLTVDRIRTPVRERGFGHVIKKYMSRLSKVAVAMQHTGVGGSKGSVLESMADLDLGGQIPEDALAELLKTEWLLESRATTSIRFQHQMFQEYFAAEHLLPMLRSMDPSLDLLFDKREWHHVISLAASDLNQERVEAVVSHLTEIPEADRLLLAGRVAASSPLSSETRSSLMLQLYELLTCGQEPDDALEQEVLSLIENVPGWEGIDTMLSCLDDPSRFPPSVVDKTLIVLGEKLARVSFGSQGQLVSYIERAIQGCLNVLPEFWSPLIGRVNELVGTILTADEARCHATGRSYLNALEKALLDGDDTSISKLIFIGHVGAAAGDDLVQLLDQVIEGPFPRQAKAYATKRYSYIYWRKDNFERWRRICFDERLDTNVRGRNAIDGWNYRYDHIDEMLDIADCGLSKLPPFVLYYLVFGTDLWPWRGNEARIANSLVRIGTECFQTSNIDAVHIALRACRNLAIPRLTRGLKNISTAPLFEAASLLTSDCVRRSMVDLERRLQAVGLAKANTTKIKEDQKTPIQLQAPTMSTEQIARALTNDDILARRQAALAISQFGLNEQPALWTACVADYDGWVIDAAAESFSQQPLDERQTFLNRIVRDRGVLLPEHAPYVPITSAAQLPSAIGLRLIERGAASTRHLLPLLESSFDSDDPHARGAAVAGVSFSMEAVDACKQTLRALLDDPEPLVRATVLDGLCRSSAPESRSMLLRAIVGDRRDESRMVRSAAARLLGMLESPAAEDITSALLKVACDDRNYAVRCAAILSYGNCAPAEELDGLRRLFDDTTPGQRGPIGEWAKQVYDWAALTPT